MRQNRSEKEDLSFVTNTISTKLIRHYSLGYNI